MVVDRFVFQNMNHCNFPEHSVYSYDISVEIFAHKVLHGIKPFTPFGPFWVAYKSLYYTAVQYHCVIAVFEGL